MPPHSSCELSSSCLSSSPSSSSSHPLLFNMELYRSEDVQRRYQAALEHIPDGHRHASALGEILTRKEAKARCQDYAFTQGFAIVVEHNNSKRGTYTLDCKRHHPKTKDWRKTAEQDKKRPNTKVSACDCKYRLKFKRYDGEQYILEETNEAHNHAMDPDPFQYDEHKDKDPSRGDLHAIAGDLRGSSIPYGQATHIMAGKNLRLPRMEYYNLMRKAKKTPEEKMQATLDTLEEEGFHLRVHKKWIYVDNIRQRQVLEHFLFCSPEQIAMARRFVSGFCLQTDATFNINELNMPLSVLIGTTNLGRTFPIAYCFISSESAEAFAFMWACLKELFFYDDCPGPAVILGDFSLGLGAAMKQVAKNHTSIAEQEMRVAWELQHQLDAEGTLVALQLCSWHGAEAIKARMTREGYPAAVKNKLFLPEPEGERLVWKWIHSPTKEALEINRGKLLDELRIKDQNYIKEYYQRQEHQFVNCFIRLLPNLGSESTQRGEQSHNDIKTQTNRHTPVDQAVTKIRNVVKEKCRRHEDETNKQRRTLPRLVELDQHAFALIKHLITHEALERLIVEWNNTRIWADKLVKEGGDEPEEEGCISDCGLPPRFGLPCKCWLYSCFMEEVSIPCSLIHPRWYIDGPAYVRTGAWSMSLSSESDSNPTAGPSTAAGPSTQKGDQFSRHGLDLLESSALQSIAHAKTLPPHERENYAAALKKFHKAYQQKASTHSELPVTFVDPIRPKETLPGFKKGATRAKGRRMTGAEAAEAAEAAARRHRRAESINQHRAEKHSQIVEQDVKSRRSRQSASAFQQPVLPDERREPSSTTQPKDPEDDVGDGRGDFSEPFLNVDTDSDIEYLGTQPTQNLDQLPFKEGSNPLSPLTSEPEHFTNIDDFDDFPPPQPLMEWPARLSQQKRLVAPEDPTPSATTRAKRGVKATKSYKQARVESQLGHDAEAAADKAAKKEAAAARKKAKAMKPRKEDVSQLEDAFAQLGSSQ